MTCTTASSTSAGADSSACQPTAVAGSHWLAAALAYSCGATSAQIRSRSTHSTDSGRPPVSTRAPRAAGHDHARVLDDLGARQAKHLGDGPRLHREAATNQADTLWMPIRSAAMLARNTAGVHLPQAPTAEMTASTAHFLLEDVLGVELIFRALYPYQGVTIATKGGLVRTGPDQWHPVGRPEYLRQCVEMSLQRLRLEKIDLYQLHRIDPQVPAADQLGVLEEMRCEGKIGHIGLSKVTVAEIVEARRTAPVASVQNLYNLASRQSEDTLDYCEQEGLGFIPFFR